MQPLHFGLTVAEWLTIVAIMLGPILAVATQIWMQARKAKRDLKLWVFNTLMGYRATWLNPNFVQAFNVVDSIFYECAEIRQKRREFLDVVIAATGRTLTQPEIDRCSDLIAELLAKMGKELGLAFDHTQIKNTAYYPAGFEKLDAATFALTEKGLAVLEGKANIGVVVRTEEPPPALPTMRNATRP